tara:strand:- start:7842 stop:9794 length:1953 start_codon:yes stop_codon:yes gene_type:complete
LVIIDLSDLGDENKSFFKKININNSVVYCFNNKKKEYQNKYSKINIHSIEIIDKGFHFSMIKSIHEKLYKWANEIKIENENIFNYLKYKDIPSTYWLLDNWKLFIKIFEYYTKTIQIRKIIDNNIEKKMVIICSTEYRDFIHQNYQNNKNILIIDSGKKIRNFIKYLFSSIINIFYGLSIFIGLPIFSLFRKLLFKFIKNHHVINRKIKYSIFSPAFHYGINGKNEYYDKIMAPWQKFLEKKGLKYWYSDFIDFSGHNLLELRKKTKNEKYYLPLDYFFSLKFLIRYVKGSIYNFTRIKRALYNLKKIKFFDGSIPPDIKIEIIKCCYTLPFIISYYEGLFVRFLKFSNVSTILMCSEAGIIGRIFNPIAQKYGINLIGIQHGALGGAIDYPYFHIEEHINRQDYTNSNLLPHFFSFPNKTVVWSEKIKSNLIKRGKYPKSSLAVIGNMANDIKMENSTINKRALKKQYNIPSDKKIILLAIRTGGKGLDKEFDSSCLNMVYSISKKESNFFILSKIHPLEKFKLYYQAKKNLNIPSNNLIITKNINIKTAILISDIVISVRSTIIFEAMEYNKPVIIINPENSDLDALEFSKTGAVFYAVNQDEIETILKDIRKNSLSENMIRNQNQCIEDFLGENNINQNKIMEHILL